MRKAILGIIAAGVMMSTLVCVHAEEGMDRQISVSGTYTVSAVADEAYVNIGVKTNNVDYKACQEENKTKMNDVIEAIKGIGIEERFIKTTTYVSNPIYDYVWDEKQQNKREFRGYEITHSLRVTLSDISLVGQIIDITVEKGVNELNNVQFALTKPKVHELYLEALAGASGRAKDKAKVLSESFGVGEISVKQINAADYNVSPYPMNYSANYSMPQAATYDSGGSYTTITSGELEVTATVSVVYSY